MATKILCDRCEKEAKPLVLDFGFTKWTLTPAAKQASGQIELHAIPKRLLMHSAIRGEQTTSSTRPTKWRNWSIALKPSHQQFSENARQANWRCTP